MLFAGTAMVAATPHIKYRTSIVVWIVLGVLVLFAASVILLAVIGLNIDVDA